MTSKEQAEECLAWYAEVVSDVLGRVYRQRETDPLVMELALSNLEARMMRRLKRIADMEGWQ
jgi:hypothetical protein